MIRKGMWREILFWNLQSPKENGEKTKSKEVAQKPPFLLPCCQEKNPFLFSSIPLSSIFRLTIPLLCFFFL